MTAELARLGTLSFVTDGERTALRRANEDGSVAAQVVLNEDELRWLGVIGASQAWRLVRDQEVRHEATGTGDDSSGSDARADGG